LNMAGQRRILLLITDLKIGGTPTVVRELATRLHHPPEVAIHVACLDQRGPVADEIEQSGIAVTALNACCVYDFLVIRRLIKLIRQHRFDTVLSFLVHANAAAAVAARFCPGVHFLQSIQTTQRKPRWHWPVQRIAQHAADRIVVPSESVAAAANQWAGVDREKIVIIPNGVDVPTDRPTAVAPQMPHRVVFLGRLDPVKRLPDLIQAIALLDRFARLDIYGDGSERPKLQEQIQRLKLTESITLHGSISGPRQALKNAELLVLPSEAEGFGLVLIEAMAAGVPAVATDAPGIRDVVRHGTTGLLVPVGSPAALSHAIRTVLEDQTLRQNLTAAAWLDVRQRFTWTAAMEAYRRFLRI
jgi:glycosyltransferase involved in cell wall biosynthesis